MDVIEAGFRSQEPRNGKGIGMTYVALELLSKDAGTYPLSNMLGAGGPSPTAPGVFEVLLSDLQWPDIQAYLDSQSLPYKYAEPSAASRVARNRPHW